MTLETNHGSDQRRRARRQLERGFSELARVAVLAAVVLSMTLNAALGQGGGALSTATPEYKCHVQMIETAESVIRFYSTQELPVRFSDQETFDQAPVRDSLKARVSAVHECVRIPQQFSDPAAIALEQRVPR